jgi:hypothetical protein
MNITNTESKAAIDPQDSTMSVKDIQVYCSNSDNMILAHGTTAGLIDTISNEGLLLRGLGHSTVVLAKKGMLGKNSDIPVTEYQWVEPRSLDSEGCSLIFEIPSEIITLLEDKKLNISQRNIFSLIYQPVKLKVTEDSYDLSNPVVRRPPGDSFSLGTPGYHEAKKLPVGSTYEVKGIPPEFILAATTKSKVLFENKNRFSLLPAERQKEIIDIAKKRLDLLVQS